MQIKDLVKPIEDMSDDELLLQLRKTRANRMTIRPAAKAREKREVKKGAVGRISAAEKILAGMTPAQRKQLMLSLGVVE